MSLPVLAGEGRVLGAISLFALVNVLAWSVTIPFDRGPDERAHFDVVRFEAEHHRIPEVGVDDPGATIIRAADGYLDPYYTYSAQPGLSYIISAATIELAGASGDRAVALARAPGMLYGALFPLVLFLAVRAALPRPPELAVLAALIGALWPQITFVFSYVNNDGLTLVVATATIASWYGGIRNGWRGSDLIRTGALAGLVLLNKPNGYPVAAATFFLIAFTGIRRPGKILRRLALAGAATVVVAGWWFAIAFSRYGTDLFGEDRAATILADVDGQWASGRHYGFPMWELLVRKFPRFGDYWISAMLKSGFGIFDRMTLMLPTFEYYVAAALVLLSLVGILRRIRNKGTKSWTEADQNVRLAHWVAVALIPTLAVMSLYRSWAVDFQAQGRHLFPAAAPFLTLLAMGLVSLAPVGRWAGLVGMGVSLVFLEVNARALWIILVNAYAGSYRSWFEKHLVLGIVWFATTAIMIAVVGAYWWRMGGNEVRSAERADHDSSFALANGDDAQ